MAKRKRPKAQAAPPQGETLKEAVLLLPLTYNDGTEVPDDLLSSIEDEIFRTFHGWTIEGVVKGAYRMASGEKRVEALQKLSVVLPASKLPILEAMLVRWATLLGQEAMLLKVSDFAVKLVKPPRKRNTP